MPTPPLIGLKINSFKAAAALSGEYFIMKSALVKPNVIRI